MEDESSLDKIKHYEEICRQAWEMAFGADSLFTFHIDIENKG